MLFLNFGGNENKYRNFSDMNFFMITNVINVNRYSDPDPLFPNVDPSIRIHYYVKVDPRIRIHFSQISIPGSGFMSK